MSDIEPVHQQNSEIPDNVSQDEFNIELQNYYRGLNENSKKLEWTNQRIQNVLELLDEYNTLKSQGRRPTAKHYHYARKYDVMIIGNQKVLILKRKANSDPLLQIIPSEEYYQKILDAHIATGHGRRDKIIHTLKDKYVVAKVAVSIFLNLCKTCLSKKSFPKKGIVVKPLISDDFNRRGQIDLVDFQTSPDQEYKWLLQYQDHFTKFCFFRPLKSEQAKEVAIEILKIFLEVGCPHILQSDNGREFTASVLKEIVNLWPDCKIVNGRPRYPQCQGSIEHSNQDVKNMIRAWMRDNKSTNWSIGCYFVQFQKNSSYHSTMAQTPYKALFGEDPKLGLSSTYLSKNIISNLENEEDVEKLYEDIYNNKEQNSEKDQEEEEQENINTTYITKIEIEQEDTTTEERNYLVCSICKKESSGAHTCAKCKKIVHPICGVVSEENEGYGSQLLCYLCVNERNIVQERTQSHINLKRAADKIISISSKKFKDISTDSTVLVEVPKVDNKNLIGKVLMKKNKLYKVGTAFDIMKDLMPRNAVLSSPNAELLSDIIPEKIKSEPLFECQSSLDADNDSDGDYMEPDNKSNSDVNITMDPLSTVLNSDLGIGSIELKNKEVVRLKIELLKYKMETEKLKRKRIEDLIQADAAERETKAIESSLKLRAARLEAIAAEMKLPPTHPALAYTAEETRAQHYIHQYHAT